MMRKAVYSCTLTILGFVLLLPACDLTDEYDITIWNDTSSNLSIFLDGSRLTEIAAGGRITIRDVEAGDHSLEAKKAGVIIETISFDLDDDMEWDVHTYAIRVINDTDYDISLYLDGIYQYDLDNWDSMTITNVLPGSHTLQAKDGDFIVGERNVYLDSDIEWTIQAYEIEIINNTNNDFEFYIDGIYQFDVLAWDTEIVYGIPEGVHLFELRIGNVVYDWVTTEVDENIVWNVY